jgi:hypothetical protein
MLVMYIVQCTYIGEKVENLVIGGEKDRPKQKWRYKVEEDLRKGMEKEGGV